MYLREFTQEGILDSAVIFHDELNPALWKNNSLKSQIRYKLLAIAKHFINFIDIPEINLKDITISGSNAAYTYTPYSDLDLHLIVNIPADQELQLKSLFDAKKNHYNFKHNIKIKGIDVELYVQDDQQPHHSAGIYSVLDNRWINEPKAERVNINDDDVENKVNSYIDKIQQALKSKDIEVAEIVKDEIAKIRKAGLAREGEFSVENLTFKVLRSRGLIEKLRKHIIDLESQGLGLAEHKKGFRARKYAKKTQALNGTKKKSDTLIGPAVPKKVDDMKIEDLLGEGLRDPKDNPCWKGYKPVGTKKKGGRTVPNCVPKESTEPTVEEIMAGKLSALQPGVAAEIDHGNGTKTQLDLKKNPSALTLR